MRSMKKRKVNEQRRKVEKAERENALKQRLSLKQVSIRVVATVVRTHVHNNTQEDGYFCTFQDDHKV